jgi:aspartyl-tRNA(Asn)/glutamyl-tRNA(Gln) amidotransferase subunit C
MKNTTFSISTVDTIAKLAKISITAEEKKTLAEGFTKVLGVLDQLKKIDVVGVEPIHQVTGLENVTREDEIDVTRILTQDQALANAPKKYNGFFVVDRILE